MSKLQSRNSNSYFNLLLYPGSFHNDQLQPQSVTFFDLNVNSLLPKIDELRNITKLFNAEFIGVSKSKLDDSVLSSDIHIDN